MLTAVLVVAAVLVGFVFRGNILGLFSSETLSPLKYVAFKADDEDRWGILELSSGKIVIENEWENKPSVESDGIIKVRNNDNLIEFYKVAEKPVRIGDEYRSATDFSGGLAAVARDNEYVTVINTKGKEVMKLKEADGKQIERVGQFKQGLASFRDEDGKWGFLDKKGMVAVKAKYTAVGEFNEGLAMAILDTSSESGSAEKAVFFVNKSGEEVVKLSKGDFARPLVSEGMIIYSDNGGDTYGVLNVKGDKVVKPSKNLMNY